MNIYLIRRKIAGAVRKGADPRAACVKPGVLTDNNLFRLEQIIDLLQF